MDDYVPVTKGPLQRVLHSSTTHDDEQLYRLDVLDLAVTSDIVYTEFKEQFQWSTQDWYQTGLPWKPNHLTCTTARMEALLVYQPTFEATT